MWTGGEDGLEVIHGDILLDQGLVQQIGYINVDLYSENSVDLIDARGKWVSPGYVHEIDHLRAPVLSR